MLDTFRAAMAASAEGLPAAELVPQRLAEAAAQVLPVAGVGLSLYFATGRRLPLGASDPVAASAERLQFTVGEGPCLSAHAEQRALVADEAELAERWPVFTAELVARTPVRGVIALPLEDGLAEVGVLDLYVVPPHRVGELSVSDALVVTREVTRVFQETNGPGRPGGPAWLDSPAAQRRSLVWQAMGFVNVSLRVDSPEALALLRAYAYGRGTDVDDVAAAVLDRSLPVDALLAEADAP